MCLPVGDADMKGNVCATHDTIGVSWDLLAMVKLS
jgi:hypothetical protein